jgi:sterol desaturase/sphingolipid hydroxylase (fatty acid hydroxylase superfamily)
MIGTEIIYQAVTLVVVVGILDAMERKRPRFPVDRTYRLGLNITAIIVVILAGELWKPLLLKGFDALRLSYTLDNAALRNLPGAVKIPLSLISADFCLYWVHRGMHRNRILWLTHIFHHSIDQLWWLSGSRTSATHLLLFAAPQTLIGYYILHFTPAQAGVAYSVGVVVNVWIHTNISVDLGPLNWLLITPDFHRIHHGGAGLINKNLGFILTVWDRLFGTCVDPREIGDNYKLSAIPTQGRLLRLIAGV